MRIPTRRTLSPDCCARAASASHECRQWRVVSLPRHAMARIDGGRQHLQQGFRLTRHPHFPHDLARIIHDADARFLDRHIESTKIGHAALLLLLMLEAADADLVSPSA